MEGQGGMIWVVEGGLKLCKGEEEHDLVKSNLCLEAGEGEGYWETEGSGVIIHTVVW